MAAGLVRSFHQSSLAPSIPMATQRPEGSFLKQEYKPVAPLQRSLPQLPLAPTSTFALPEPRLLDLSGSSRHLSHFLSSNRLELLELPE